MNSRVAPYFRRRGRTSRQAQEGAGRPPALLAHGVLLEVHGLGVLLQGPAGIGKSALARELLARGHRLVADDAVELERPADGVLVGRSPDLLRGLLEVRGLGILDVRKLHGRNAVRESVRIDLVVQLERRRAAVDRLRGRRGRRRLLGVTLDRVHLNAGARAVRNNLPGLVETACLDQELRLLGLAADGDFERRQQRAIHGKA